MDSNLQLLYGNVHKLKHLNCLMAIYIHRYELLSHMTRQFISADMNCLGKSYPRIWIAGGYVLTITPSYFMFLLSDPCPLVYWCKSVWRQSVWCHCVQIVQIKNFITKGLSKVNSHRFPVCAAEYSEEYCCRLVRIESQGVLKKARS